MNDQADITGGDNAHRVAAGELRNFIERIERLEDEKAVLSEDIKAVKAEAKSRGYDGKMLAEMIRLRRMDAADREAREELRTLYGQAIGVFS